MNNRKMKVRCFSTQCRKMWLFHTGAGKWDFVSSFCCSFGSPTVSNGHSFSIYCVYKDKSTCTNDFPALVHFISESWCLFWKFLNSVGPLGQPHSKISTQTPRLRKKVNSCRENICTLGLFFYTLKLRRKVLFILIICLQNLRKAQKLPHSAVTGYYHRVLKNITAKWPTFPP